MTRTDFLLPPERMEEVSGHYRFEDGKAVPCSKWPAYRIGSDHASGGAGCVSTVDDYIKFAEALRTGERLLKRETIRLMTTDRLTEHQKRTYTSKIHGYGLGMRAPMDGYPRRDYGWGGAAGAFLAIDEVNNISLFYAQHLLSSPNQALRGQLYTTLLEDLGISAAHTVTDGKLTY
jgi:CubicO group peptidase (beta-lactamase class C family)